jgi:hypothetical protein
MTFPGVNRYLSLKGIPKMDALKHLPRGVGEKPGRPADDLVRSCPITNATL